MATSIVLPAARLALAAAAVALLGGCEAQSPQGATVTPGASDGGTLADSADIAEVAPKPEGKLQFSPEAIDFGDPLVGTCTTRTATLRNVGAAALAVSGLDLQKLTPQFSVRWLAPQALAGQSKPGGDTWPLATPLSLAPNQSAGLAVVYCRGDAAAFTGSLAASSDAGAATLAIDAKEAKSDKPVEQPGCPVAAVKVAEGNEVVVHTTLHLSAAGSKSPTGTPIASYQWAVSQPSGSNQPLSPSSAAADVTLQVATVGSYTFCLNVWDAKGLKSCMPACTEVQVFPGNEVSVELTWAASKPTEDDDQGIDLDLHFAHPMAKGLDRDCDGTGDPWFSNPWDAFWYNKKPSWGAPGGDDDPVLSGDDQSGAKGESVTLATSEGSASDPVTYTVGVHAWNDHGLGAAKADLKVWALGGLVMHLADVELQPGDLWTVGRLHWPNTLSGGSKAPFEPCKQQGKTCAGGKTKMWQSSGQWCVAPCYKDNAFTSQATKPMATCSP